VEENHWVMYSTTGWESYNVYFILRCLVNFASGLGKKEAISQGIYLCFFAVFFSIDIMNVEISKIWDFANSNIVLLVIGEVMRRALIPFVAAFFSKETSNIVLDNAQESEAALIEEVTVPKRRGRPPGARDKKPRHRRTKAEIEAARASGLDIIIQVFTDMRHKYFMPVPVALV